MFAAIHVRSVSSFLRLCDLRDFCVEIPLFFDSYCYTSLNNSAKPAQKNSFQISALRTLSFSVSCKSCICHSYENCRVCTNNSHSGTRQAPFPARTSNFQGLTSVFSHSSALFCTHKKLNSFVFMRFRTLCEKTPGVGGGCKLLIRSLQKDFSSDRPSKMDRSFQTPLSSRLAAATSAQLLPAGSILWVAL